MIHPQRPLVIYQSMALQFFRFTDCCPSLQLTASSLEIDGKRGNVVLEFELLDGDEVIGAGEKRMILSNLVPYDASADASFSRHCTTTAKRSLGTPADLIGC